MYVPKHVLETAHASHMRATCKFWEDTAAQCNADHDDGSIDASHLHVKES